ncbi:MAG TPA: NADH-quinone oxidoreductase subunit NuoB [Pseudomonadota bacterium]|nr:NADH-quinone oxidoreductase subunit NuoB [Pseudomonadota bacterium]HNK43142.1 NADH-quinone oxidoreductase subunit NuoB [Pseudomonadota bacterium]HNN52900.1 NADH-quinone oxidoreductase subunit NuoB [Pseudomonadota bacterium]
MAIEDNLPFSHPLYDFMMGVPGLSVATGQVDKLLTWGLTNSLWVFPMATSCCGIELMATAASRVDIDRMGTIVRGTPRQADVMVVAGTITVKMAPRVKKLWDLMPEPKWCIAMGSCAISGDFYRDLYPTVPGIDTFLPVDVYVPGCPPNPEALMAGMLRLQEKVRLQRAGKWTQKETRPETAKMIMPALRRLGDPARDPKTDEAQLQSAMKVAGSDPLLEAPTAPRPATTSDTQVSPDGDLEAMLRAHGVSEFPKDAPPLVPVDRHRDLAQTLKKKGFRQLVTVVASHYPGEKDSEGNVKKPEQYEVMYGLRTTGKGSQLALWRVRFESPDGIDSLYGVFAGADWQEREQFDLVGVRFAGHPDLRRILLPHDYSGFPLRRDHAADAPCAPWR